MCDCGGQSGRMPTFQLLEVARNETILIKDVESIVPFRFAAINQDRGSMKEKRYINLCLYLSILFSGHLIVNG